MHGKWEGRKIGKKREWSEEREGRGITKRERWSNGVWF